MKPALEHVADSPVLTIKIFGIADGQALHNPRHGCLARGLDDQVHMIRHEGISMQEKAESLFVTSEQLEILQVVISAQEDWFSVIASSGHMVQRPVKAHAWWVAHNWYQIPLVRDYWEASNRKEKSRFTRYPQCRIF